MNQNDDYVNAIDRRRNQNDDYVNAIDRRRNQMTTMLMVEEGGPGFNPQSSIASSIA